MQAGAAVRRLSDGNENASSGLTERQSGGIPQECPPPPIAHHQRSCASVNPTQMTGCQADRILDHLTENCWDLKTGQHSGTYLFLKKSHSFNLGAQYAAVMSVVLISQLKNQIILKIAFYCNRHFQNLKLQFL